MPIYDKLEMPSSGKDPKKTDEGKDPKAQFFDSLRKRVEDHFDNASAVDLMNRVVGSTPGPGTVQPLQPVQQVQPVVQSGINVKAELDLVKMMEVSNSAKVEAERAKSEIEQRLWNNVVAQSDAKATLLQHQIDELRANRGDASSMAKTIADWKTAMESLGLASKGQEMPSGDIAVKLKELEINTQIELQKMRDNHEVQMANLALDREKFQEERQYNRDKLATERQIEVGRTTQFKQVWDDLFSGAADSLTRAGQEISSGAIGTSMSNDTGQAGLVEVSCQKCGKVMQVPSNAVDMVCPGCGQSYVVQRE